MVSDAAVITAGGEAAERALTTMREGGRVAYPNGWSQSLRFDHSSRFSGSNDSQYWQKLSREDYAFDCYYCSNFQTNVKGDYEHHVIFVDPNKPAYPSKPDLIRLAIEGKGKRWEN